MKVHLEVTNKPNALNGKTITHRNIQCICFEYEQSTSIIDIYETYEDYISRIPSYRIVNVTRIVYWNEEGGVN